MTEIDRMYEAVCADADFRFGVRMGDGGEPDQSAKRFIVELYESVTGKRLIRPLSETSMGCG